jgi:5-methylcytosine-specific restriction protein A
MPSKPKRLCNYPGCNKLTEKGYCNEHRIKVNKINDSKRKLSYQRGYTSKWSKESKYFLAMNPWCAECLKKGIYTAATETDHIIPHKGNLKLFWDRNNWQPLCHSCHSKKTATEDGGFGNYK